MSAATKSRPKSEPKVRPDKRCAKCGGPRLTRLPKVITQRSKEDLLRNLAADPFCQATCCRAYYGLDIGDQPEKSHGPEDE